MTVRKVPIDDTAAPVRATPRRVARSIEEWSAAALALATRGQSIDVFLKRERFQELVSRLAAVAHEAGALAALVLVGDEPLAERYVDVAAGRGVQPVIDVIEARAAVSPGDTALPSRDNAAQVIHEKAASAAAAANPIHEKAEHGPDPVQNIPSDIPPAHTEPPLDIPERDGARPWATIPVASLNLPRRIQRDLVRAGAKTAGEADSLWHSGAWYPASDDDRRRVREALDELIAETEARTAAKAPDGVMLDANGRVERIEVPSADPASGEEIVFDRNGTHKRDAATKEPRPANALGGKTFTREELGLTDEAFQELDEMSSSHSLIPAGNGKPSKLSGIFILRGQTYAVTGVLSQWRIALSLRLVPAYRLDDWPGETSTYHEKHGRDYHGIVAELMGTKYVLGRLADEVTVTATEADIEAAKAAVVAERPELADRPASTRRAPKPSPRRPDAAPAGHVVDDPDLRRGSQLPVLGSQLEEGAEARSSTPEDEDDGDEQLEKRAIEGDKAARAELARRRAAEAVDPRTGRAYACDPDGPAKPKRGRKPEADGHDPDLNQRVLGKDGTWLRCLKCQGDYGVPAPPGRGFECHKPRNVALAERPCPAKNWDRAPIAELSIAISGAMVAALEDAGFTTVGDVCQAFTTYAAVEGFDDFDRDDILEAIIAFKARAVDVAADQVETTPDGGKPKRPSLKAAAARKAVARG